MTASVQRLLWLLAWGGLGVLVAFSLFLVTLGLTYPYQLDYGESALLWQTAQVGWGENIYKDPYTYPYIYANYPPLLLALTAPFISVLGLTFLPGRLLIGLAVAGLALVTAALAERLGAGHRGALLAGLLFVASPYVYHWAPLYRTDLPALLFSSLGVLVAWRGRPPQALHVAGVLCLLSLYTKQTMLAAPLAIALILGWQRRWRDLLRFAGLMAGAGGGLFVLLTAATQGSFFFGIISSNVQAFYLGHLRDLLVDFGHTFAVTIALALMTLVSRWPVWGFPDAYALLAIGMIVLAGKVGAWENYFLEALVVLCAYAAVAVHRLATHTNPRLAILAPIAIILQVALMWHTPEAALEMVHRDGPANRALAPLIKAQVGDVIAEDLGLLVLNGRGVNYYAFLYTQLAATGRWDQSWELENLRAGRFPLVVLDRGTRESPWRFSRFSSRFLSELDRSYALSRREGKYEVYAPAPLARSWNIPFGDTIALVGSDVQCGESQINVSLLWEARGPIREDYTHFVHIQDATGVVWAQHDGIPREGTFPTRQWQVGDLVRDTVAITPAQPLPPGRYTIRVGLYGQDGKRLSTPGSDSHAIASCLLGPPSVTPDQSGQRLDVRFQGGVVLVAGRVQVGQGATLTLSWRTESFVDQDATVFVHVLDGDGHLVTQGDAPPDVPLSLWNPGDLIPSHHHLDLASTVSMTDLWLSIGLYNPVTLVRLPRADGLGNEVTVRMSDLLAQP